MLKVLLIEFQAFVNNLDTYIVKELCFANLNSEEYQRFLFKPPYEKSILLPKAKVTNNWLEKNWHEIGWYEGEIEYSKMRAIIRNKVSSYSIVVTKGREKALFLEKIIEKKVINAEDITNSPTSFKDMVEEDFQCTHRGKCAVKNVFSLRDWLKTVPDVDKIFEREESGS